MDIQTKDGILLRNVPDGTSDDVIKARLAQIRADGGSAKPQESASMQEGRGMNSSAQGFANAMQGPLMGFADEIYGGLSAAGRSAANLVGAGNGQSFGQNYEEGRDLVRGATEQFRSDRPWTAGVTGLMASAPTIALMPGGATVSGAKTMGGVEQALRTAGTGAMSGGVSGAGESVSNNLGGVATDAAKGAALGGAFSGASVPLARAAGAVGSNIAQRFSESSAADAARLKLAEALMRDASKVGASNPAAQAAARMEKLGAESTIADAAGHNVRQSLDTLATLPGEAKNLVEAMIRNRQAGRSARIMEKADDALGTQGMGYASTLANLDATKKAAAKPFYDALEGYRVPVDKELRELLIASEAAHGTAEQIAKLGRQAPLDLSAIKSGKAVSFDALDKVKQALWEAGDRAKGEFGKATPTSRAFDELRVALTKKMDDLSPKDAGGSIYAQARNAYGGAAQLEEAVKLGRGAMKADAIAVADMTKGMGASELEAFRVGALQSIRDKVGSEAGQTSLLKMWKETGTSDKLRQIFGDDYRKFSAEIAKESRLKQLESTGRGSQTAARLFGAGDMDMAQALSAAGQTAMSAAGGHPMGAVASAARGVSNAWNQVKTPEETRNALARLLMLRGPAAAAELQGLPEMLRRINETSAARASIGGGVIGQQAGRQ